MSREGAEFGGKVQPGTVRMSARSGRAVRLLFEAGVRRSNYKYQGQTRSKCGSICSLAGEPW